MPIGAKAIEIDKAETVDELIQLLNAKKVNGLAGTTKLQYIIMQSNRQLVCMYMTRAIGKQVVTVLKHMFKGD